MIRMLNAYTLELDDTGIAVAEILEQLDLDGNLLPHTAAFATCSYDFIESGILQAVSEALPFDVVGMTTLTSGTNDSADTMQLSLSVLTSDDCRFSTAISPSITDGLDGAAKSVYDEAAAPLPGAPTFILAFFPMVQGFGGELILGALARASGDIPVFGSLGCDHDTAQYPDTYIFRDGVCSQTSIALMLIEGNIEPHFFIASASEDKIQKQKAIITAAEGSVLKEVNNLSTMEYLETLGLVRGDGTEGLSAIPFVVNYNDGTQPVARAIYMLTAKGWAVCGGEMPVDATLSIGSLDYADVLSSAEETMREALAGGKRNGLILFPCLGRSMVLGANYLAEVDVIRETVGNALPWHFAYSGGEICPVYDETGKPVNRYHNFTFIGCIF